MFFWINPTVLVVAVLLIVGIGAYVAFRKRSSR
jgi:hypothetical protein